MNVRISIYLLCLLFPAIGMADKSSVDSMKLQKLNQSSQQKLEIIQSPTKSQTGSKTQKDKKSQESLNLNQQIDQLMLQENQKRKQATSKHRTKASPSTSHHRIKSNAQHQQFRQEQKIQLNRFRLQQQK